jgi:hypothetical protein
MHAHQERKEVVDRFRAELDKEHALRDQRPYLTWVDLEIDFMHRLVNKERSKRGLPDVDRAAVVRADRCASGHVDYASKFSIYCTDLVFDGVGNIWWHT